MKPSILLLTYFYPPDIESGALRPFRLAKYLGQLGHTVEVIAAGRTLRPVVEGNVHRLRSGAVRGMPRDVASVLERVFRKTLFVCHPGGTWAPRVVRYARQRLEALAKPVLISTAPPITVQVAAWRLKRRCRLPWIADFRDPRRGGLWRADPLSGLTDWLVERAVFGAADAVVGTTDGIAERWRCQYPQAAGKIHVVWNGFDPEQRLRALPLPPRPWKVLAHVGAVYGGRDPGLVLQAAARLLERGALAPERFRIHFVGLVDEAYRRGLLWQALAARGCLELTPPVPREQAYRIMAEADYLLLLDMTGKQSELLVPAKLFEYVQIGRPIVACTRRDSPADRILRRSGIRFAALYPDCRAEEIDRELLELLQEPPLPRAPAEWFETSFDGRRQAAYISELACKLAGEVS